MAHQVTSKTIILNGLLTTSYISVLISTLWCTDKITTLGSHTSIYVIATILALDFIKSKYLIVNPQLSTSKIDVHSIFISTLTTITFYFIIAILYGAPVLSAHEKTLMFALLLTACTTGHSLINVGVKESTNIFSDLITFNAGLSHYDLVLRNVQGSLIGAWCFTAFIPLDWDVPWQQWPTPCSVGALVGHMAGHAISIVLVMLTLCCKVKRKRLHV